MYIVHISHLGRDRIISKMFETETKAIRFLGVIAEVFGGNLVLDIDRYLIEYDDGIFDGREFSIINCEE